MDVFHRSKEEHDRYRAQSKEQFGQEKQQEV